MRQGATARDADGYDGPGQDDGSSYEMRPSHEACVLLKHVIVPFLRTSPRVKACASARRKGTFYGQFVVIYVVLRARTDWASRSGRALRRGIWRAIHNAAQW